MRFRKDFTWGIAAASYQIEGGSFEDGRGLSVWDTFCRKEGVIWRRQNGDVACDHYHRYKEDVSLMKGLGIKAYRMSISWPRIIPEGKGSVNTEGLNFYDRLIDELMSARIDPWITLFHWDYPHELYCRGGWLNQDSSDWFAEYAKVVVERLSDRVSHWMTLNEPQCFIGLGHQTGYHAPGNKLEFSEVLRATHNTLLAHGKATQVIRNFSKSRSEIGLAPVAQTAIPLTNSEEDIDSARKFMFSINRESVFNNTWWLEPIFWGRYPEDGLALFKEKLPEINDGDMEIIQQPLDFFGANIYHGRKVMSGKEGVPEEVPLEDGYPKTAQEDWPVTPDALYWGPRLFYERYGLPIVITENGYQNPDVISLDGKVHDPQRINYLQRYLIELNKACTEGIPVKGYFQWTFCDNFEWTQGYSMRVGIVYVDYPTQKRILKDSAYWYRDIITSNGATLKAGK